MKRNWQELKPCIWTAEIGSITVTITTDRDGYDLRIDASTSYPHLNPLKNPLKSGLLKTGAEMSVYIGTSTKYIGSTLAEAKENAEEATLKLIGFVRRIAQEPMLE